MNRTLFFSSISQRLLSRISMSSWSNQSVRIKWTSLFGGITFLCDKKWMWKLENWNVIRINSCVIQPFSLNLSYKISFFLFVIIRIEYLFDCSTFSVILSFFKWIWISTWANFRVFAAWIIFSIKKFDCSKKKNKNFASRSF